MIYIIFIFLIFQINSYKLAIHESYCTQNEATALLRLQLIYTDVEIVVFCKESNAARSFEDEAFDYVISRNYESIFAEYLDRYTSKFLFYDFIPIKSCKYQSISNLPSSYCNYDRIHCFY